MPAKTNNLTKINIKETKNKIRHCPYKIHILLDEKETT